MYEGAESAPPPRSNRVKNDATEFETVNVNVLSDMFAARELSLHKNLTH